MPRLARTLGLAVVLLALTASAAPAATLNSIGSFDQPIFVTSDPVDPDRLFVVEQPGLVAEVLDGGLPQTYADLTEFVACCGERGLLSIAPARDFHKSGLFYAAYTGKPAAGGSEGDIHVDAFVADENARVTRTPILSIPHSQAGNHNGGQLQLGPEGHLYISTGDGGGGGDPFENGQNLSSLLGKILRIDPRPGSSPAYSIPAENPFAFGPGADEVWAYGLRNPWRFSFDRESGDLWIADVGQNAREEVNHAQRYLNGLPGQGDNYGWSCREGLIAYTDATPSANCVGASGFTDPVFDYPHSDPDPPADRAYGCSITGGYVVRDQTLGDLYGRYLYADYCVGEIRSLAVPVEGEPIDDRSEGVAAMPVSIRSFGEDSCGRLYVASGSEVFRFEGASAAVCPENPEPEPPGEEHPPPEPTSTPNPIPYSPPPPPQPPVVILEVDDLGDGRLRLFVTVRSCTPSAADSIQLNRGGRLVKRKPLNGVCGARFRAQVEGHATFRALYRAAPDAVPIRSNRLAF